MPVQNSKNNTVIRAMPVENKCSVNLTPSQAQQTPKNTVTVKNPSVIMKNVSKALSANIQQPGSSRTNPNASRVTDPVSE